MSTERARWCHHPNEHLRPFAHPLVSANWSRAPSTIDHHLIAVPYSPHNTPTTTHSLTYSVTRHNSYMIYTVWRPVGPPATSTHMSVERLNSKDYLSSALEATLFTGPDASADEAPVLLKRKGVYYVMFGHGCCFCEGGSGVNVFTSSHPLGPYQGGSAPSPCVVNKQSTCYFCLE
jgi:hypothetical protein